MILSIHILGKTWKKEGENIKDIRLKFIRSCLLDIKKNVYTIYIKIRYNPPDEVVCISFHEDQ
jgi:hypothetical protein